MESLRVYPPVPMTVRKVREGHWVEGMYLPKGTLLNIPVCHTFPPLPKTQRENNRDTNFFVGVCVDSRHQYLVKDMGS